MGIQQSREMMHANFGAAARVDAEFTRRAKDSIGKLEAKQSHAAEWRRLSAEGASWLKALAKKSTWGNDEQGAWEYGEALISYAAARADIASVASGVVPASGGPGVHASGGRMSGNGRSGDLHRDAFADYLRSPHNDRAKANLVEAEMQAVSGMGIYAAGSTLSGPAGGHAVPAVVSETIGRRVKEISPLRMLATNFSVTSTGTRFLVSRNDASSAWVGETGTRNGTTEPVLDNRAPTYGTVYAKVEATEELLLDSAVNIEQWFSDAVVQQLAQAEGAAFVSGDGTNKPTGFLSGPTPVTTGDATRASGTLQFVPSGAVGEVTADALNDLFFALKAAHRSSAAWLMNSATASVLMKLKDGEARSLWQPSLAEGTPNTLLGRPVYYAEDMPSIAEDAFPIAFGNFAAGYIVADSGDLRITVDDNVTKPGYVSWYVRRRVGGVLYDSEAIKLLKIDATP